MRLQCPPDTSSPCVGPVCPLETIRRIPQLLPSSKEPTACLCLSSRALLQSPSPPSPLPPSLLTYMAASLSLWQAFYYDARKMIANAYRWVWCRCDAAPLGPQPLSYLIKPGSRSTRESCGKGPHSGLRAKGALTGCAWLHACKRDGRHDCKLEQARMLAPCCCVCLSVCVSFSGQGRRTWLWHCSSLC